MEKIFQEMRFPDSNRSNKFILSFCHLLEYLQKNVWKILEELLRIKFIWNFFYFISFYTKNLL